jgi:hypothetical protein
MSFLGVLELLKRILTGRRLPALSEWFRVRFDEAKVFIEAEPPGREPWKKEFPWDSVRRVMFRAEGMDVSDGIYVFTSMSSESFVIPNEARGGLDLW